ELKGEKLMKFAKQLELTAWREELHRAVLLIADDEDKRREIFGFEVIRKESVPLLSQIRGLRSVIMRLKDDSFASKKLVTDWAEHLQQTSNRFNKWEEIGSKKSKEKKIQDIK